MFMDIDFKYKPSINDIVHIEHWLNAEYIKNNEGFFCNIEIIKKSFKRDNSILIFHDKKPVGFITYTLSDNNSFCFIDFISIKEEYRNKGVGKKVVNHLFEKVKCKKYKLQCAPISSYLFWSKMGFSKDIKDKHNNSLSTLYMIKE